MIPYPALQPEGSYIIRDDRGNILRDEYAMPLLYSTKDEADQAVKDMGDRQ